jgi:ATP-dependent helicase/nuclease subunit A
MSERNWTKSQREAIDCRQVNLLVAAGAGSGKTAVLVERVIRRISDPDAPVDVDRLLVVTFTNAAAAQMRKRVAEALERELERNPGTALLEHQLRLLPQADITTVHSFCAELLRRYCHLIDLDPEFRVADETEAAILRQETLDEFFEAQYQGIADDPDLEFLVEAYGGERDDLHLQNLVLGLHRFARSNPWPRAWLERAAAFGTAPAGLDGDGPLARGLRELVASALEAAAFELKTALEAAEAPGGPAAYADVLAAEIEGVEGLTALVGGDWESLRAAFLGFAFTPRLPAARGPVDEVLKGLCTGGRKKAKGRVDGLKEAFFEREPRELQEEMAALGPAMCRLAELTADFGEAYRTAKLARNLVDFADLEHYAQQILLDPGSTPEAPMPSPVAAGLREYYAEVLVDEYQDINAVQELILRSVSRQDDAAPNLFMVGDVKQSIYRFRLAEPALFLEKYRTFETAPDRGTHAGGPGNRRIDLSANFRSRASILHAVNAVFRRIMTPAVGELAYDAAAELVPGDRDTLVNRGTHVSGSAEIESGHPGESGHPRGWVGPPVEVHLVGAPASVGVPTSVGWEAAGAAGAESEAEAENAAGGYEGGAPEECADDEDLSTVQREARLTAGIIRRLAAGGGGDEHGVPYREIVVLMRAVTGKADIYLEEFRRLNIPAYAKVGTGYFEAVEVETVLSLLKVIDNPHQDIPLAAVLRSPLVGLGAAELARIRLADQQGDFLQAVRAAAVAPGPLGEVLTAFLARLEKWRSQARRGSPADLIWDVYRTTGYYDYAGGLPGGAGRQANLRALYDRARQYEATSFRGLFRFLRFIELLREGDRDLGPAPALAESENVVRIMSIHQAKGLEFPVVILAGLGRRFYMPDLNGEMLLHKDLGPGPYFVDPAARVSHPTAAWRVVRERLRREQLAEEMRILYVAMTRARERLILTGSAARLEQAVRRWSHAAGGGGAALPAPVLAEAASWLDWVMPVLTVHPDGEPLRRLASGCRPAVEVPGDQSRWEVHLHGPESLEEAAAGADPGVPGGTRGYPLGAATPGTHASGSGRAGSDQVGSGRAGSAGVPARSTHVSGSGRAAVLESVRRIEPVAVPAVDGGLDEAVRAALSWSYPAPALALCGAKVAATEVKRRFAAAEAGEEAVPAAFPHRAPPARPAFLEAARGLSPAAFGRAMHLVLQHLDLGGDLSADGIRAQVVRLAARELLTEAEARAVDAGKLAGLFAGGLGRRFSGALWVRREWPFCLAVPAKEVYPELEGRLEERVMVQGIIDCLFAEPDGLVLVDYKTGRVEPGGEAALVERYRGQMALYARAVEAILGQRVKERHLFLLMTGSTLIIQ